MTERDAHNDLDVAAQKLEKNAKTEFKKVPLKQLELQLFRNLNQEAIRKVVEGKAKARKAGP